MEEHIREDIAIWHQDPQTLKLSKEVSYNAIELHDQLLNVCASSVDPAVRSAYSLFATWNSMAERLGGSYVK